MVKLDAYSTWKPGMTVTTRGRVAKVIWQHLMGGVPGKQSAYFDLDENKTQIVVYWRDDPKCFALTEVTGKVLEVRGSSKRPGSKVDDSYAELHLDVESTRCVE